MSQVTMNVPQAEVRAEAGNPPNAGRDEQGKFIRGNKGGPGNPFARKVAAIRKALVEAVSEDEMKQVQRKLLEMAKEGNIQAAKLLYQYSAAKPAPPPNPDTLDIEEWEHYKKGAQMMVEMPHLFRTFTPEYLTARLRETRQEINHALGAELAHALTHPKEYQDSGWDLVMERPEKAGYQRAGSRERPTPSTPSSNGQNGGRGKKPRSPISPSVNGDASHISVVGNGRPDR